MQSNFCNSCEVELKEGQETVELFEDSDERICLQCAEDLKSECPGCSGRGCAACLCTDW